MRCLKRRLSDVVYRQLVKDAVEAETATMNAGPGGHSGATLQSSAAGLPPHTGTSDQPLPGPAAINASPDGRRADRSRSRPVDSRRNRREP